jgi:hypothetical protein
MDKVQKHDSSKCDTPSSEPFRIDPNTNLYQKEIPAAEPHNSNLVLARLRQQAMSNWAHKITWRGDIHCKYTVVSYSEPLSKSPVAFKDHNGLQAVHPAHAEQDNQPSWPPNG